METLATDFHILHKPTVPYSPWENGAIESITRTVLAAFRPLMLELKLAPHDWKEIITAIPSIINTGDFKRLGSNEDVTLHSPLQVMTGISSNCSITRIIPANSEVVSRATISDDDRGNIIKSIGYNNIYKTNTKT